MTTVSINVINKDGKINTFTDQKSEIVNDLINAVSAGCGFVLEGPHGVIAYGPGSIARVGIVKEKEKTNANS